ncbi:MAG: hypothetical protein HYV19_09955 [Gemmatimonadetes bacterium]|nr:hypothetical protein [Gemmatimonadota bacterium]
MRNFLLRHVHVATLGALLLGSAASAASLGAQQPDARWQPWIGCWSPRPAVRPEGAPDTSKNLVCVTPAKTGDGVEIAVMANDKLVRSEVIAALGQRVAKSIEGCPGWESATWSLDGHRLMARSEVTCGNTVVKSSSVFGISADGEWIEVRGALVGDRSTVNAVRYVAAPFTLKRTGDAAQPFSVVADVSTPSRYARLAAGGRVSVDAVLDVTRHVEAPVAEAWLNEVQQGFEVNAKELVRLADAGMPPNVIDLLVALSNPRQFAVQRQDAASVGANVSRRGGYGGGVGYGRRFGSVYDCGYGFLPTTYGYYGDPCYPGYFGYGAYGYGSFGYGAYGYGPSYYGYGYGYPYGYSSYGGYYYGPRPLVIVPSGGFTSQPRGQAVKGSGYTRRGGSGTTATPSQPRSSTGSAQPGSSSSGSSSGSTSGSSGSGSSGGRTAKPRPPQL